MDPINEKIAKRNLYDEFRTISDALHPYELDARRPYASYAHERATSPKDVMAVWDKLLASSVAKSKLSGILIDTGVDASEPQFTQAWFGGSGAFSTVRAEILLDRIRFGLGYMSGVEQLGYSPIPSKDPRTVLGDIVQDVAMALLGHHITIPPAPPSFEEKKGSCGGRGGRGRLGI